MKCLITRLIGPLVTFALLANNQEDYIREAVQGTFAQAYKPLEITLSDDCSSDRTDQIMQEMAGAYRGPDQDSSVRRAAKRGRMTRVKLLRDPIHQHTGSDDCNRAWEPKNV